MYRKIKVIYFPEHILGALPGAMDLLSILIRLSSSLSRERKFILPYHTMDPSITAKCSLQLSWVLTSIPDERRICTSSSWCFTASSGYKEGDIVITVVFTPRSCIIGSCLTNCQILLVNHSQGRSHYSSVYLPGIAEKDWHPPLHIAEKQYIRK